MRVITDVLGWGTGARYEHLVVARDRHSFTACGARGGHGQVTRTNGGYACRTCRRIVSKNQIVRAIMRLKGVSCE